MSAWKLLIRGEVAELLEDGLVLNIGMEQGVKKRMKFVVYEETPQHIFDTKGKDLGPLEIPKAEVEIVDVQEKLSIAKNTETSSFALTALSAMAQTMQVRRDLLVDEKQITKVSVDPHIKKGDKVRQAP